MHCIRSLMLVSRSFKRYTKFPREQIERKNYIFSQVVNFLHTDDSYSEDIINELCKGNEELEKKLRVLMLEVEVMRQDGRCAPDNLQTDHWERLMNLPTRSQRNNYLTFLWKTEKAKENYRAKKEARRKEIEAGVQEETKEFPDDYLYGIKHRSLFLRIRDQSINNFDNYRALQAIQYGQPIVLDCSYEHNMIWRENVNAAKQMTFVFGDNRIHKEPFNIYMCNVNLKGEFMKQFRKNVPSIDEPWFPLHIETKSYLDIFPKEKLVYLTPHCRDELTKFDPEAVYIVGCMVDKVNNEPLSLAKAKRDGIKMAKLPLDRYLEWAPGAKKNLNINHMIPILLDLRFTGDWEFALRHIPRRKLMETKIMAMEKKFKNNPLLKEEVLRNVGRKSKFNSILFREKRHKSSTRHSLLYDDDNI